MTDGHRRFWIIGSAIAVAVLVACLMFVLGVSSGSSRDFSDVFEKYQTLIAALIALAAAIYAATPVIQQLGEMRKQTKVQAFESLHRIGSRIKECELEARAFRLAASYYVNVEDMFRKQDPISDDILKMTVVHLRKYDETLSNKIDNLTRLDSFRLQPFPPPLLNAFINATSLIGKSISVRTELEVAEVTLRGSGQRTLSSTDAQQLQVKFALKDKVVAVETAIDMYLKQIEQELISTRISIGSFDFTA